MTLATILKDNWEWRKQIGRLALFDLVKKSRGAVLGWAWFFIKPAMYIFLLLVRFGNRASCGQQRCRRPSVHPVAVRRSHSVVLHAGHVGAGSRRAAPVFHIW